jgi:hypothetical protein
VDEPSIYRRLNDGHPDLSGDPDDGEEVFFDLEDTDGQTVIPDVGGDSLRRLFRRSKESVQEPGASEQAQPFTVLHVATMLCSGDVYYGDDQTAPQTTLLHKLVGDNEEKRRPMQQYIHFHMVLKEVGKPLEKFESVPDLLQVISDVVVGT